jgi:hypothetical protein
MSLLKEVHSFIKFAQLCNMFMCDFIIAIKICEGDVYQKYCDIHSSFQVDVLLISKPWVIMLMRA